MGNLNCTSSGVADEVEDDKATNASGNTQQESKRQQQKHNSIMGMSRTASGTDINERAFGQFAPTEKLSKILQRKSTEKTGVNGVSREIFVEYVFGDHPALGTQIFNYMYVNSKAQTDYLGVGAFRQQCERLISILDETVILEIFIRMFCDNVNNVGDTDDKNKDQKNITPMGLHGLLLAGYELAMLHYSPLDVPKKQCSLIECTLDSVTTSCFFTRKSLSTGSVCRWIEQNLPRLIPPIHHFTVHRLTTGYRTIDTGDTDDYVKDAINNNNNDVNGLTLRIPGIQGDKNKPFCDYQSIEHLMCMSRAWLLACALPLLYCKPQLMPNNRNDDNVNDDSVGPVAKMSALTTAVYMSKITSTLPSHWTLLYDSYTHGCGANRFLHHVLGYKGPTLCLISFNLDDGSENLYCGALSAEWRESHLYVGDKNCYLIQMLPKFAVLEKGPNLFYLNTSVRGYAKGLRIGSDSTKPILSIDEHFDNISCNGSTLKLSRIEVWGCGDQQSRDIQLDIKKWQVKEAERQRVVKLTAAEWIDNPDRYLLELGGRPQYNIAT